MGHRHSREELLVGALEAAKEDGISRLSYGRVAARLGVSDRMLVYYFPTKDDLVGSVLGALGLELQQALGAAFHAPAADHLDLARAAWPALATPELDPVFAVFFEANGLAAAGHEPYRSIVGSLVTVWIDWLVPFLDGPPRQRRAEAEAAVALIDGLLLLRQLGGAEAAQRAAQRMGIA